MISVRCDACDGEGGYEAITGANYSMSQEQYYPRFEMVRCDECNGAGWVTVEEDSDE